MSTSSSRILGGVPLLAGLSENLRERLATGTEEVSLRAGEWLFHEGESADSAFVVSGGRVEVISEGPPNVVIRALKRGEVLGEIALLRAGVRTASARARRDSTLIELGREQFELLIRDSPEFALGLTRAMGEQIAVNRRAPAREIPPSTVGVIGLHPGAPANDVAERLAVALAGHGTLAVLREDPQRPPVEYRAVLDRAEHAHDRVLLVGGNRSGADETWTEFCLRESDLVLAVTEGAPDPAWLARHATLRGCELIIVGREIGERVAASLAPRETHLCYGRDALLRTIDVTARRLCGRAIGLVLSGGGARAFAHLGVLDELHAAGVQVDRIAGVSMGALIGANAAMGRSPEEIYEIFESSFIGQNPTNDYTIPAFSVIRGRKTRRMLEQSFGSARIEALPHRFFCVSCDLISREMVVHRAGLVREAVYPSLAIPGVFPPVADGRDRLLVDGGVLDNLPVQTMARSAEGPIIAVDVSQPRGQASDRPGRPRLELLARPLRRALTGSDAALPRLGETLMRTLTLGSEDTARAALEHADLVISPEVEGVGMLQWDQLPRVRAIGRAAAQEALASSSLVAGAD